jgi:alpha-amylase/alpha-mannosidase (GH57 family)
MPQTKPQKYSGPILKVGFLWHQHQPFYKDLRTGEYVMPWVRLHAIKDYLDMVEILGQFPAIKQTFNMVPSLLEQLDDYIKGVAIDPHLGLSMKKAESLTPDDKTQILNQLFQANYDNLIAPNRRYFELFSSRERAMATWTADEWRDLQVLANLAWIDPMFKSKGRLKDLAAKGERYTEEEKQEVFEEQRKIIEAIVPALKRYMDADQIEVSVTPYFHPIMPLLYDTSSALVAMPGAPMPKERFQHPEDVARQVEDAVQMYQKLFGRKPRGMWPSEGSVSEDIIPILAKYGIEWIATDEEILAASLGVPDRNAESNSLISSGQLYRGYRFEKQKDGISIFFRDHALSDNIGFVYSGWNAGKAADDFVGKLSAIHKNLIAKKIENPIVCVILDGENAWEYYKNDGHDFLDALYQRITDSPWIETTTFSQYLDSKPQLGQLKKLFPGSWISHNFSVWIGHTEDNKAWDMLTKTRAELVDFEKSNSEFDESRLALAWKEIMIAEGSDWCWWFGDDHVGPHNDEFDRLFRSHLANVYYFTDREPPVELFQPVRSNFMLAHFSKPVDYIKPAIDGRLTHFYEWQQAGFFDCAKAGSTMHKAERLIAGWWFGFDQENIYFRIDRGITVSLDRFAGFTFEFEFRNDTKTILQIQPKQLIVELNGKSNPDIKHILKDILEISVPLKSIPGADDYLISVRLIIREDGQDLETWPPTESLRIELPGTGADIPWVV